MDTAKQKEGHGKITSHRLPCPCKSSLVCVNAKKRRLWKSKPPFLWRVKMYLLCDGFFLLPSSGRFYIVIKTSGMTMWLPFWPWQHTRISRREPGEVGAYPASLHHLMGLYRDNSWTPPRNIQEISKIKDQDQIYIQCHIQKWYSRGNRIWNEFSF